MAASVSTDESLKSQMSSGGPLLPPPKARIAELVELERVAEVAGCVNPAVGEDLQALANFEFAGLTLRGIRRREI